MLFLYKAQEIAIQCRMAEVLETAKVGFEELSLSESEYHEALIDKNELLINGKLYDIKSQRFNGDRVLVMVMEDNEEEGVLRNIWNAVNGSSSNNVPDGLLDLLTITYILPAEHCLLFYNSAPPRHYSMGVDQLLYHTAGIVVPPPDMI